ncbi:MAG: mannose-1-phosphate guanylyltransferase [candidate division KSB1 bacterium]|nr:mannose-1-phosphate guanylyltransferase [candidate division KSB1 bacterium]
MNKIYPIILAGGTGTRFWPKSRVSKPKQYLSLFDDVTLIQATAARLLGVCEPKDLLIVTSAEQSRWISQHLPWVPPENVIYEPARRNTGPAVGLAALQAMTRNPDAVMVLAPADHLIRHSKAFVQDVNTAVEWIQNHPDALMTLGVPPTFPATGFGYIRCGQATSEPDLYAVSGFSEKPDSERAQQYLQSGDYLWNCGMFVWRADTILNAMREFMPELYKGLLALRLVIGTQDFESVLKDVYKNLPAESIDYGIMEHTKNAYVIKAHFDWNDIGSWKQVFAETERDAQDNVVNGRVYLKDTKHCYIEADDRTVAVIGLENTIIIQTRDALLICDQDKAQDVKWLVNELEKNNEKDLL